MFFVFNCSTDFFESAISEEEDNKSIFITENLTKKLIVVDALGQDEFIALKIVDIGPVEQFL